MKFAPPCVVLGVLGALFFCGCSPRTEIKSLSLSDGDVGITMEVPVKRDGTFALETKRDNVVAIASGKIVQEAEDWQAVEISYERKVYSTPAKCTSEKLEVTLRAKPHVEVSIGQNPTKPSTEQVVADNALTHVTLKLLK